MDALLPIIRRARRPLLPPDDPAPVAPPSVIEPPAVVPLVEPSPVVSKASGRLRKKDVKAAAS